MTILCGTDFSAHAGQALQTAAWLAQRSREELVLIHVSSFLGWRATLADEGGIPATRSESKVDAALDEVKHDLEQRLEHEAEPFAAKGVSLRTELLEGVPDEVLVARAEKSAARLIVIGALGRRSVQSWTLGSTADRTAQRARVPVLVVRRAQAFEKWIDGSEPLRILLCVDDSDTCDHAIAGLERFVTSTPCTITGAHVYWPPEQRSKHGASGPIPIGAAPPEIESALKSELERRLARNPCKIRIDLRLIGGLGRPADHLVKVAADLHSDLIVVGTHQRTGLDKLWHGSVSHGVIDRADTNVLCIPTPRS
jgi:nucleotide-binding universal stress UspA family protein